MIRSRQHLNSNDKIGKIEGNLSKVKAIIW